MRTWYEPEEAEEFEAARSVLLRRCLTWADEHGRPADDHLIAAAVEARHHSRDGRLAYWDETQIRRYLLAWVPKYVVAPREILEIAPEILRTYLHYLTATGLRDPRGATLAEADEAITRTCPEFHKALDDPYLQGLAKFWAQTALDHGNDLADPGAVEEFKHDLNAGRIRYDQDVLDKLMASGELDLEEDRASLQPPITLPSPAALAEAAAGSTIVRRLIALATWAGKDGRPLTRAGNLSLAAARDLSALLGTGEQDLQVRTAADLPHLSFLLAWARKLRLVRVTKGRLCQVGRSASLLRDPAALWTRAFETLPELGPLPGDRFRKTLPDVLNTMYGMDDVPVTRLAETVWPACQDFILNADAETERVQDLARRRTALDLHQTFEVLALLGAVELTRGPAPEIYLTDLDHDDQELPPEAVKRLRARLANDNLLLARLTPLAQHAIRASLLSEGRDAPLVGELSAAPPAELLGVLAQHYPPKEAAEELNAWLSHPGQDVESLLEAVRACPYRTRAAAMLNVLAEALPQGQALIRTLRHDPVLGPTALTFLVDDGEVDPAALAQREHLLLGAENFLILLELGGPQTLIEQLKAMAGKDAYQLAASVLSSGHHDRVGLAEMHDLIAEPLRTTLNRPFRLIPGAGSGSRGRGRRRNR